MNADLPKMSLVRQSFDSSEISDLGTRLREGLRKQLSRDPLPVGSTVAIGVGSRGVSPVVEVVQVLVQELEAAQLHPFIVPAMGSHGGATAQGQATVLRDYGVCEDSVGAPI